MNHPNPSGDASPLEPPSPPPPRLLIRTIQREVAAYYKLPLFDMTSRCRDRAIARPRQVAMFLARELTPHSLTVIGRRFGGRDHSTVAFALYRVEKLCRNDDEFAGKVDALRRGLVG